MARPYIAVPPDVVIDSNGRYQVPCRTCGKMRSLLWHGTASYESRRYSECASCSSKRTFNLAGFVGGVYIEPDPDPLTVDLLVSGEYRNSRAYRCERLLAATELWRRNPQITARTVAERLGVTRRTVERYRRALRQAA
jgi:hypothetical protein